MSTERPKDGTFQGPAVKLVVAIVQDYDVDALLRAATTSGLGATRLASTGGFLRTGNTTVLMAVQGDRVGECLALIRATSGRRAADPIEVLASEVHEMYGLGVDRTFVGGGIVMVAPIARVERF